MLEKHVHALVEQMTRNLDQFLMQMFVVARRRQHKLIGEAARIGLGAARQRELLAKVAQLRIGTIR